MPTYEKPGVRTGREVGKARKANKLADVREAVAPAAAMVAPHVIRFGVEDGESLTGSVKGQPRAQLDHPGASLRERAYLPRSTKQEEIRDGNIEEVEARGSGKRTIRSR